MDLWGVYSFSCSFFFVSKKKHKNVSFGQKKVKSALHRIWCKKNVESNKNNLKN